MLDSTYREQLVTNFRGAALQLDQPDIPAEAALLAQNVEFYAGVVRTRRGFAGVLATITEGVSSLYNWVSTLGNFLVRYRKSDRSVRITNIATGADTEAVPADLLGFASIHADAGANLYTAVFLSTTQRGATAGRVTTFQSAAFVSDKLFQGPITYVPAAPAEPGAGVITVGLHKMGYRIEYRSGFITRPSPDSGVGTPSSTTFFPVDFTAAGSKNAAWTLNTTWPAGAVRVHVLMAPVSNPGRFFFVPGANAAVVGGTAMSVTITFDIDDDVLYLQQEATDSLLLMTNSVTGQEQIQPYVVLSHGDRMAYLCQLSDSLGNSVDSIYMSQPTDYENITADQNLIQLPGRRQITTSISMDGNFYMFGPHWTYRTIDSGGRPIDWPAPILVDGARGTLSIHGAEVSPSGTYAWIADQSGLYFFNSSFPEKPLSYYQLSDWLKIRWAYAHLLAIKDDATNQRVNVFVPLGETATEITHWMSWDYSRGWTPERVNYTLNDIHDYVIGAAEFVENTAAGASFQAYKHKELWIGPSGTDSLLRQATLADQAPWRDNDAGIAALYRSNLFPDKRTSGQLYMHHGANYRVKGEGSLLIRAFELDYKRFNDLAMIDLELAPGQEYFRGLNKISEAVGHEFTANLLRSPNFLT